MTQQPKIPLEDVNNPKMIKDGVIQSELLDIQKLDDGLWHVIHRQGGTLEEEKQLKQQILDDAKKAEILMEVEKILSNYCGETSQNEGLIETLNRKLQDSKIVDKIRNWKNDVKIQLETIEKSEPSGSDYHLKVLDLHTKLESILKENDSGSTTNG